MSIKIHMSIITTCIRGRGCCGDTIPNSKLHEYKGLSACDITMDCHPQTIESGISIEVLDKSGQTMRVTVRADDEYIISKSNTEFSEIFPDEKFCNAIIEISFSLSFSNISTVLWHRYINSSCRPTWTKIARRIGGENTGDGVRKKHDRYIQKC